MLAKQTLWFTMMMACAAGSPAKTALRVTRSRLLTIVTPQAQAAAGRISVMFDSFQPGSFQQQGIDRHQKR